MNAQQTTLSSDSANNSDILPSVASMDNTVTTETVQTVSNNERLEPGARTPTNPFEVVRPPPSETDSEVNTTQYVTASAANSDQLGHTSSYFSEPVNFTFKNDAQKANYLSFTDYMSSQYPNSNISEVHAALRDRILSTWLSSRREDQQGDYPTRSHWKGIRVRKMRELRDTFKIGSLDDKYLLTFLGRDLSYLERQDPLSLEGEMGEDDDSPYRPVTRKDHLLDTLLTKEMRVMVDDVGRMRRDSKNRLKGMVEERLRDLQ
ncbi:hypothetical protein I203_100798 [Kwoniella mangroviensis CBS 8507]|uniref:uncharacterized protein n=1 Tax=Kwoniella mangroviensis CBS 8507 TaxID=1296122 RepID=UPI00080D38CD|nr:uncharacterized protein I203_06669 [Kwoniella mangroviensis CBS 8507]OCF64085.1 hypothetical protein I203_06669 [Kwoniella mangroviensis CBS 8507]